MAERDRYSFKIIIRLEMRSVVKYCIDKLEFRAGRLCCTGWAAPELPGSVNVYLVRGLEPAADARIVQGARPDVAEAVYGSTDNNLYGFTVSAEYVPGETYSLHFKSAAGDDELSAELDKAEILYNEYRNEHSLTGTFKRFLKSTDKKSFWQNERYAELEPDEKAYAIWKDKQAITKAARKKQMSDIGSKDPLISIVVPVFRPKLSYLKELVTSIKHQTYRNWELCISCAQTESSEVRQYVGSLASKDARIRLVFPQTNDGISEHTNRAIEAATGSWIAFADQDDLLAPNALYEYVRTIRYQSADAIYCDEDKKNSDTGFFCDPNFKPDFNPDLLTCNNYIGHMFMVRRTLLDSAGMLKREYDGAQDHDFNLRCSELTKNFVHIPKILYSWRLHSESTAADPESKSYAYDAGARAIQAHFDRLGIEAKVVPMELKGWYRTCFTIKNKPLVSVIIPNKDHAEDLERCIDSLYKVSDYSNIEVIIVENNSADASTFDFYKKLESEHKNIRIITWKGSFNYSAINNFAAKNANGEYLLLLNNDTQVISNDFLDSMLGYAMRSDVGAVGARLYYEDHTVQHAGVLVGVSEGADHVFLNYPSSDPGYMGRSIVSQDMSAVTAACMLTRADVYRKVGGLDEEFVVAYNDVDYCLKVRTAGFYVVYDAFAELYHFESKSRGYEDTQEKQERFEEEKQRLLSKWRVQMLGDPYYNINLSLKNGYYKLP